MRLDVDGLAPEVLAVVQVAAAGREVELVSGGRSVGILTVRMTVSGEGATEAGSRTSTARPERVIVVATAMALSDAARRRLSDELGDDFIVVDITAAPSSADVILAPAVSPQLLGFLRSQFPNARIIISEIEDAELGVNYSGPLSRLLDAGAEAYLPPRRIAEVAVGVRAHLQRQAKSALDAPVQPTDELTAAPHQDRDS